MKMPCLAISSLLLCGCVDLGHVTRHPETTTGYLSGHRDAIEQCLEGVAAEQRLLLEADDPLPGGVDRFNLLNPQSEVVAWVEVAKFSQRQTSVQFYYAPDDPHLSRAVATMIAQCDNP
ncbi:hypothetical protein [Pantoea sp. KPR_PJ]|uniref:hypothetical protein n=1 Tax=Pantoea sp. KPR_PJ TaxID=2738375 RepID=UPI0035296F01